MKIILATILLLLSLVSCSTSSGYKKEGSSQNQVYEAGSAPTGIMPSIPLFSKKIRKNTLINGNCLFIHDNFEYPAKFTKVELYFDEKKIFKTTTDNNGDFSIFTYLKDGDYTLVIDTNKYKAEKKLKVDGLKHTGLKLVVAKVK